MDFLIEQPDTVEEAVRILAERPGAARAVWGGSDLVVEVRDGLSRPEVVVDLTRIRELVEVRETGDGGLSLGAGVPLEHLARRPELAERFGALAEALRAVGSVPLRFGSTLGGNLATASPAADSAPPLLVLEAEVEIAGPGGRRRPALADFFQGPRRTVLGPGEIITRILLPPPPPGARGTYLKFARRRALDLALVSVAALGWPDAEAASGVRFRLAAGAVAPTPLRLPAAEEILAAGRLDEETRTAVRRAVEAAVRPIDDVRAAATYRREMAGTLALRAVDRVLRTLEGGVA